MLRQDTSKPTIKSLSPRPETKISLLRSPRLPNINPTQRLSNKFFNPKSESPRFLKSMTKKRDGLEASSPSEEKKNIPARFTLDDLAPIKTSASESVLEDSIHESKDVNLKNEVDVLKLKLQKSVFITFFYCTLTDDNLL